MNFDARLKKIEKALGREKSDPWAGVDPESQNAIASYALAAALAAAEVPDAGLAEPRAALLDAAKGMDARLKSDGLLMAPLDDVQRARVREIAAEMKVALPPHANSGDRPSDVLPAPPWAP